ncbi:MAG TPA: family 43 glycosylhydrolase [Ferruginibacter sp.]|mgnify:CR=1 FL=1|nr:family 43 glycosylhydrolase [Ferruginibacter sp.]HMP21640.1 family 43 glycosylhydrolase [Ferruginibacter sp.]
MQKNKLVLILTALCLCTCSTGYAQNPLIRNQFSADPSARVFNGKVYVYPSHDILATEGKGQVGWFCMEDYHVFSSHNLTEWIDHGVIITQNKVPWVRPDSYAMWAPDCIEHHGKYYFYFPAMPKDTVANGRGFAIGVAVADTPEGPFIPEATPIKNVHGIDPNVFIDKDGQTYLYWSAGNIYAAPLKENMLELAAEPIILTELPSQGLKEGPYLFERNGIYYLTYPHVDNKIERLEYATGNHPLGPFKVAGVIMDESPTGCWTNHQSIIQYNNQWYLFYHHNDYSPAFDKARSIRADSLFFLADGSIQKVIPTLRGIGHSNARKTIHIDRYSAIANEGAAISFIDTTNNFKGWKTSFVKAGAWVQYNSVDFGKKPANKILVKANAPAGAALQVHTGGLNGPVIAKIKIPATGQWKIISYKLLQPVKGIQQLFIQSTSNNMVDIDWIQFE